MRNILKKIKSFVSGHSYKDGNPRVVIFRMDHRIRKGYNMGFTLVETLVAISILMLSVTGPLYYASESLKAATYARDQITAFYLAQDAFEQIRKIRDDNVLSSSLAWNNGLVGCEISTPPSSFPCVVTNTANPVGFYTVNEINSDEEKYLYVSSFGLYSHNTGGTKSIFKRSVQIVPTVGTNPSIDWTGATEMKVTVSVDWNSRGVQRNFTAYEFLRNLK